MNLETKITIYKFTPQLFTLTQRNFKTGSWEIISANYQLSLPEYLSLLPELIL